MYPTTNFPLGIKKCSYKNAARYYFNHWKKEQN